MHVSPKASDCPHSHGNITNVVDHCGQVSPVRIRPDQQTIEQSIVTRIPLVLCLVTEEKNSPRDTNEKRLSETNQLLQRTANKADRRRAHLVRLPRQTQAAGWPRPPMPPLPHTNMGIRPPSYSGAHRDDLIQTKRQSYIFRIQLLPCGDLNPSTPGSNRVLS